MARGYQADEIKQKLVEILNEAKTGLSGVEISEKIGVNRVTMTKYLNIFSAEGLIRQKNIGNIILWFVEEGTGQFQFPDDYFQVQKKYQDALLTYSENQVYTLIRNCIYADAKIPTILSEIIIPAVNLVRKTFDDGKIGNSELNMLNGIIYNSVQLINLMSVDLNPKKNVILISADSASTLLCEASSTSFRSDNWSVFSLGDMSESIDVLFDLDLQKFLRRIWKQKIGIMIVVIFSQTEEGLNFFAESVNSVREKIGKKIHLVLCGKVGKKIDIDADLISEDLNAILQWSQDVFESSES
jgi:hypothetical protein